MLVQLSICRWIYELLISFLPFHKGYKRIPVIRVESPKLTVSYYREYLGFSIFPWVSLKGESLFLVKKANNWIWVKKALEQNELVLSKNQKITIYLNNIEHEYKSLVQRVWLVKPMKKFKNKFRTFTIRECNGIDIVYACR